MSVAKIKTFAIYSLLYFIGILVLVYFFGSTAYDPYANWPKFSEDDTQLTRPLGGLLLYKLSHPFYTPVILMHGNELGSSDIFSHLEIQLVLIVSVPYWIFLSICFALITTFILSKSKKFV